MAIRLGLTGGVGSGKTTVANMLGARQARVIDADAISRGLTATGGSAIPDIQQAFGDRVIAHDGSLNRDAMRALVFADAATKRKLELIIHPLVAAGIALALAQAEQQSAQLIVLDIPLLVESGRWRALLDYVVVVDCDSATQIQRVQMRSGWAIEQIHNVIAAQAPRALRLAAADIIICNQDISLTQLETSVSEIAQQFGL